MWDDAFKSNMLQGPEGSLAKYILLIFDDYVFAKERGFIGMACLRLMSIKFDSSEKETIFRVSTEF